MSLTKYDPPVPSLWNLATLARCEWHARQSGDFEEAVSLNHDVCWIERTIAACRCEGCLWGEDD